MNNTNEIPIGTYICHKSTCSLGYKSNFEHANGSSRFVFVLCILAKTCISFAVCGKPTWRMEMVCEWIASQMVSDLLDRANLYCEFHQGKFHRKYVHIFQSFGDFLKRLNKLSTRNLHKFRFQNIQHRSPSFNGENASKKHNKIFLKQ